MTSRSSRIAVLVVVAALAAIAVVWIAMHRRGNGDAGSGGKVAEAQTGTVPHRVRDPGATRRGPQPQELALQIDDDPAGSLRLEGQVVKGADQAPVGGAVVTIDSNPPRMARTEQDGSFFFDKLLAREYSVVARAPAGVAGPVTVQLDQKTEPVILRLRAGARVEVTVAAARDHKPLAGATVELRGLDTRRAQAGPTGSQPSTGSCRAATRWWPMRRGSPASRPGCGSRPGATPTRFASSSGPAPRWPGAWSIRGARRWPARW